MHVDEVRQRPLSTGLLYCIYTYYDGSTKCQNTLYCFYILKLFIGVLSVFPEEIVKIFYHIVILKQTEVQ